MDKIKELQDARLMRTEAEKKEECLFRPVLFDFNNIETIYTWFSLISIDIKDFPQVNTNAHRQRFIFIILLLYSPGALLGDRLPNGIASKIQNVLKIRRSGTISENCDIIPFYYQHEKIFRSDVDYLYAEIQARIDIHGLK